MKLVLLMSRVCPRSEFERLEGLLDHVGIFARFVPEFCNRKDIIAMFAPRFTGI
jgi:hypothetical protein